MTLDEQLLRDEGLRLFPYQDMVGKWTIGVGRNLTDDGISKTEALFMLGRDIDRVSAQLDITFPWTQALDPARRGALLNMAFNLGIHGLAEFTSFLTLMQTGAWEAAALDLAETKWAKQVPARAARLMLQIKSGEWH